MHANPRRHTFRYFYLIEIPRRSLSIDDQPSARKSAAFLASCQCAMPCSIWDTCSALPSKLRLEPGLLQFFYGRLCQIEPTRAMLGMMQLSVRAPMAISESMVAVPVVMRMASIIRQVISLLTRMLRLAAPLRFVLPMLYAVMIPTLLWHTRQTTISRLR